MNGTSLWRAKRWVRALLLIAAFLLVFLAVQQFPALRAWCLGALEPQCTVPASADELRLRTIKAYLRMWLAEHRERRGNGVIYELALIPRPFDAAAIERGLREGSLLEALSTNRLPISSAADIDKLDASLLTDGTTVLNLSTQLREAMLIPVASIRPATAAEVEADSRRRHRHLFRLDDDERARGFGLGWFWITVFPPVSLSCCDGLGAKHGLSPAWHVDNDIKTLSMKHTRFMAVNACGAILSREIDGYVFHGF